MSNSPPPLDALETFLAVVREGSFTGAAASLGRTQPAISYTIGGLERDLGVSLFDRSGRRPELTDHGRALLEPTRAAVAAAAELQARAAALSGGVEARLAVAVDPFLDWTSLVPILRRFQAAWPATGLEVRTEALGAVAQLVLAGSCDVGVATVLSSGADGLVRHPLVEVDLVAVCARDHALAGSCGPLAEGALRDHVQLVLTDRSPLTTGLSAGVLSPRTWRFADLHTRYLALLDGFGWCNMPRHAVAHDLAAGRLVALEVFPRPNTVALVAIHRADRALGPAARWWLDALLAARGGRPLG